MNRVCKSTGKVRHPGRRAARAAHARIANCALEVYFCRDCKGFHIGHTNDTARLADRITQLLDEHKKAHP